MALELREKIITALFLAALLPVSKAIASTYEQGQPAIYDQRMAIQLEGQTFSLAARIYRPPGSGPFPLVVINHGTPADKTQLRSTQIGFKRPASWFVSKGYVVVIALRPGFGTSEGEYREIAGSCKHEDYVAGGQRTAAIESAIVQSASALPFVDPRRIVVVGQSAGGFGAVALADAPPPGVVGIINFAGGRGSDGHGNICNSTGALIAADAVFGKNNRLPQLWLYAANDQHFNQALAHAMVQSYQAGSRFPVQFTDLPPFEDDGHKTFAQADPSVWAPYVSSFLGEVMPR